MLASKLLSCAGGEEALYSDDVFQSYTRTGTGADAVVTTGIDMTKGYMLWSKGRSGATDHAIYDSARGVTFDLVSNTTAAQTTQVTGLKAVSSTGHTVGSLAKMNTSSATYVDWIFRKSAKFFDVLTWTGDGVNGRFINHSLGVSKGIIIIKRLDAASVWTVRARNSNDINNPILALNLTDAAASLGSDPAWTNGYCGFSSDATRIQLLAGTTSINAVNASGGTYVAYLFAHDTSADGIVQCGSFTTDGSGNATVNLGWEPQYLMFKRSAVAGDWWVQDTARGWTSSLGVADLQLSPNNSTAESAGFDLGSLTATGFTVANSLGASVPFIYLAIRRPNKPPTTGTQVYNAIARTGTGAAATVTGVGFAPDISILRQKTAGYPSWWYDRLRGAVQGVASSSTGAELTVTQGVTAFAMDGIGIGTDSSINASGTAGITHFFKRAPGFHSEICYTGTGSNKTEIHDLGKAPDLMIVKSRSAAQDWNVWCNGLSGTEKLVMNSTAAKATDATAWNSTVPTSSVISLGTSAGTNAGTTTYVAYLFSNIAGIQSIGTYVGDGTSGRLINCGFTTGSRYVCIKAISATGNWLVADSVRGIVSGSDPYLALNSTAAEVTTEDWLDTSTSGFLVNQVSASNANVNGVTYMYWSIA